MGASNVYIRSMLSFFIIFGALCLSNALECKSERKRTFLSDFLQPKSCPGQWDDPDKSFCCEKPDGSIKCCDIDEYVKSQGVQYLIPVSIGVVVGILAACLICCLCCPCCMLYKRRHRGTVYGRNGLRDVACRDIQGGNENFAGVQQPNGTVVNVQTYPVTGIVPPGGPQQLQQMQQQQMQQQQLQRSPMAMMPSPQMPPQMQMPQPMPMPMPMPGPQPGAAAPYPAYPPPDFSGQAQMPPPPYSAVVGKEGYAPQAPYNPHYTNQ